MLVYAGIDEAGYGPMLGPLCVAASVFVVDDHDPATGAPDLWKRLSGAVCRSPSDRRKRIAVEDSKKLKTANDGKAHPLRHLERGVLSFAAATPSGGGTLPADDDALFACVGAACPATGSAPWYDGPIALPLAHTRDELSIAASRLARLSGEVGVRCVSISCHAVDAGEFNQRLSASRNKATVSFDTIVRLVDAIWREHATGDDPGCQPAHHPRIVIDRQGGRAHYLEPLRMCFPEASITVLGETDSVSRYRLERDGSTITVGFESESEQRHLPVALASMTAKLVRELMMARFNRWFATHRPEIKPTAGYVQDGRRWLAEMEPVLDGLAIDRGVLVRNG